MPPAAALTLEKKDFGKGGWVLNYTAVALYIRAAYGLVSVSLCSAFVIWM